MKKIIENLKALYGNNLIRLLTLVVLFLLAIFVSITITRNPEINRFGKLSYPQEIPGVSEGPPTVKIAYNFPKDLKLPDKANVYLIESPGEEKTVSLFNNIASVLGFMEKPETATLGGQKLFRVASESASFTGNLTTGAFSFTGKSRVFFDTKSEEVLKDGVYNFLIGLGLVDNISNNPVFSYYTYSGSELIVTQNKDMAKVVSLSYRPVINNIPVIGLGAAENVLTLFINLDRGNLFKWEYFLPTLNTSIKGTYSLKSLEEIRKGGPSQLKIFYLNKGSGDQAENILPEELSSIDFNNVYLAYFITAEEWGFLQPVFVLAGTVVIKDDQTGVVKAYLPAVKNLIPVP